MATKKPGPRKPETTLTGKRLASLRALYGWSQSDVALRVGWFDKHNAPNRSRIAQLETGRCQFRDVEQREKFAKVFGLSLDQLNQALRGDLDVVSAAAIGVPKVAASC